MQLALLLTLLAPALSININDPEWPSQWYLNPSNGDKVHLNVLSAWNQGIMGQGISVAVIDTGVDVGGGDLKVSRTLDNRSWRWGQSPVASEGHGTMAAGVIAAKANWQCGVGVAPEVNLVDIPLFGKADPSPKQKGQALFRAQDIDIYSNSWGTFDSGAALTDLDQEVETALANGASKGRNGKGSVYIWAAGNGGYNDDSCAYDAYINSPYTIAVSGVDRDGKQLATGEDCEAIMAAAPSRNAQDSTYLYPIVTPKKDGGRGCQYSFSASSVAAPMAAGAVALLLQARPNLGWRDVQHIIAQTSDPTVFQRGNFKTNAASFKYSNKFGFGLINAGEMVRVAPQWRLVGDQVRCTATLPVTGKEVSFYSQHLKNCAIKFIEHVVVKVNVVQTTYRGDITGKVTSPSKTTSEILTGRRQDLLPLGLKDWPVKTLRFWGEEAQRNRQPWKVAFTDIKTDEASSDVTLEIYGLLTAPKRVSNQPRKSSSTVTTTNNTTRKPANTTPKPGNTGLCSGGGCSLYKSPTSACTTFPGGQRMQQVICYCNGERKSVSYVPC